MFTPALTDFKSDVFMFLSISVSTVILRLGKVLFLIKLISETFCLLSLLDSRYTEQRFSANQDQFCVGWLSRLLTEIVRELFLDYFLEEAALSFFCLLFEPFQWFGHAKYYLNSQNFPPVLNTEGKTL